MKNSPGTIREKSPEIFPQTDRSCDGTDTDHYMQPDADTSVEQFDRTPTNPSAQNMIYVIIQSRFVLTVTDIDSIPVPSTERKRTLSGKTKNVLLN